MAHRLIRWLVFSLGVAGTALLAYAWGGERPRMRLRRYRLPWAPGAGLTILHLSDLHYSHDHWIQRQRWRKTRALLRSVKPDIILITGDFLHDDAGLVATEQLLQNLPSAPLGVYAVLGNHDYAVYSYRELFRNIGEQVRAQTTPQRKLSALIREVGRLGELAWNIYRNQRLRFAVLPNNTQELRHLLASYGVTLLENQARALPGRPDIWIAGVDDWVEGQPQLEATLATVPPSAHVILLTHHPDLAYAPATARADLVFSGHTHGGQVVLPGLGAVHTQGTRLPREHAAGYFDDLPGHARMIVSCGMGESTPFRFRCPPEMVIVEFVRPWF